MYDTFSGTETWQSNSLLVLHCTFVTSLMQLWADFTVCISTLNKVLFYIGIINHSNKQSRATITLFSFSINWPKHIIEVNAQKYFWTVTDIPLIVCDQIFIENEIQYLH